MRGLSAAVVPLPLNGLELEREGRDVSFDNGPAEAPQGRCLLGASALIERVSTGFRPHEYIEIQPSKDIALQTQRQRRLPPT